MSSFRSLESLRSGDFEDVRLLDRRVRRLLVFGFDFLRAVRLGARVRLVRREDVVDLFFATG